jgi:hypothetical protein
VVCLYLLNSALWSTPSSAPLLSPNAALPLVPDVPGLGDCCVADRCCCCCCCMFCCCCCCCCMFCCCCCCCCCCCFDWPLKLAPYGAGLLPLLLRGAGAPAGAAAAGCAAVWPGGVPGGRANRGAADRTRQQHAETSMGCSSRVVSFVWQSPKVHVLTPIVANSLYSKRPATHRTLHWIMPTFR